jgi:DNA-binding transcriptional LysR family regulator
VVKHGSFSQAARVLGISQPAVTQNVQQLEELLQVTLIDRNLRPCEPTAAGMVFHDWCLRWRDEFRGVVDRVQSLEGKVSGKVRVACIYSVGLLQMSEYVQKFRKLYPQADLKLEFASPESVYERVWSDEADIGIVSFPKEGGETGCIHWVQQPMVLAVSPRHPLAGRSRTSPEALEGADLIGFTQELTIRKETDRFFKKHRVSVNVVHEFDNVENIKRAVEAGVGVALIPYPTMLTEIKHGSLAAIVLEGSDFVRPLGIIHKRNKHRSTATEKFIELLTSAADSQSPPRTPEAAA